MTLRDLEKLELAEKDQGVIEDQQMILLPLPASPSLSSSTSPPSSQTPAKPSKTEQNDTETKEQEDDVENKRCSSALDTNPSLDTDLETVSILEITFEKRKNASSKRTILLPSFYSYFSAIFYALSSLLYVLANKVVLTNYQYPSFIILSIGQIVATIVLLQFGKTLKLIDVPQMSFKRIRKLQPLPLLYAGNLVTTLGSTKVLSLPMFSVLRRLAILFILIAEFFVLKIKPSLTVQCTVVLMIAGAFIAACNDLAFDLTGYAYVLVNNLFAASYTVYVKKRLSTAKIGAYELLYNNALLMFLPVVGVSLLVDSWRSCFADFSGWSSVDFVATFAFACLAGFLMVWSTVLCTAYNSALTTAILGTLRSILVTYLGMYISSDYAFSVVNFIGLNVSMVGSLVYCYVVFIGQKRRKTVKSEIKQLPGENS